MTQPPTDPRLAILARIRAAAPVAVAASGEDESTASSHQGASAPKDQGQGARGGAESGVGAGPTLPESWDLDCARLPLTDLGNAQRFILRHGDRFLYVEEWGWLAWDGQRWNRELAEALLARAVQATVMAIAAEATAFAEQSGDDFEIDVVKGRPVKLSDRIRKWGLDSQGAAHVGCIARLAQAHLTARPEDFDVDPMALNVMNGTLRFLRDATEDEDRVRFTPHDRADRITRLAPVDYDPQAECPAYDAFLARVQPSEQVRRALACWGGLSLTGDVSQQVMQFWYGKGGNGKSTLLDCWCHLAGDYASTIAVESFLDQGRTRRGGDATPDLAGLVGVRMLKTSEPERGAKLAEAVIKTATGDESLNVRFLNKDFFLLRIQFHLTMFGNYKPGISGVDDGIWRRVIFVPWQVQVPAEERDRGLLARLKGEASGILNRLLDGIRDYLDHGLVLPDEIVAATAAFRRESDPLGRFLEDCTEVRDGERVQSTELYKLYQAWCIGNGEKAWSQKGVALALSERGLQQRKSSVSYWLGIRLTRRVDDFVEFSDGDPSKWRPRRQDIGGEGGGDGGGGDDLL